jgi:DNA repair exonuclease SbcCD ATPase subunit
VGKYIDAIIADAGILDTVAEAEKEIYQLKKEIDRLTEAHDWQYTMKNEMLRQAERYSRENEELKKKNKEERELMMDELQTLRTQLLICQEYKERWSKLYRNKLAELESQGDDHD